MKIKRKNGVIFSNPGGLKRCIFYVSNLLILLAVVLTIYIYAPITKALINYKIYQSNIDKNGLGAELADMAKTVNTNNDFMIVIPKILAEAKIVENVSPADKMSFDSILKNGRVAMTSNSALPGYGPGSTMYLFSHSTSQDIFGARKNAVFYLLGELIEGDYIYVYHGGNKYIYEVFKSEVVGPRQTEYLNFSQKEEEIVILQTCWPLGTNWKRLLIFARRVDILI